MEINNDGRHSQLAACGAIPLVAARIAELVSDAQQSRSRKTWLDREFVMEGLKRNFERAMQAVPVLDSTGKPTGNFRYNGQVANRSLELLGKELGMFIDRHMQVQDPMSWDTKRWRQAMEKYAAKIGFRLKCLKLRPRGRATATPTKSRTEHRTECRRARRRCGRRRKSRMINPACAYKAQGGS